ncbi:MAG: hypothetical protein MUF66_03780 [Gammaproteobacteria bacterium]|jgi:hypothetical protein|nr:hypothetical protein [Gammaproteobacteria bacterium]
MRVDEAFYPPSPALPALRSGDGAGTALATLAPRTALTRSGRSRGTLTASAPNPPLQGEILSRSRFVDTGVDGYLALGRPLPTPAVPRSRFVDLYA